MACGRCNARLISEESLTPGDLEGLRTYLPPPLVRELHTHAVALPKPLLEQCVSHLSTLFEIVCTHLPTYLVEQVVRDPKPGQASGQFVEGTLLFADISGFTTIAERLSRVGREGVEELTGIINRHFEIMVSLLHEQDGQLIQFGGDSILGLFSGAGSAMRAVRAALNMQAAMDDLSALETSRGTFTLQMKAGVHQGRFFAAQLGTLQGMKFALFGSDTYETIHIESAAQAGQVLTDRETWRAIQSSCRASPTSSGEGYLVIEELDPFPSSPSFSGLSIPLSLEPTVDDMRHAVRLLDALTLYLPGDLLARLTTDPQAASLEGEHRLVAVLFSDLYRLGSLVDRMGPGREEEIVVALNRCFVLLEEAIHRYGGTVNKIDFHAQGDRFMALFGAPLTHEDDAERAVHAALAMQEALERTNLSLPGEVNLPDLKLNQRIGISYGYVFAGHVGADRRHEYTVMGDEVNLAARLMSVAAPGNVTVTGHVRRRIHSLFELQPYGKVNLKGKSEPIPVYSVFGPLDKPRSVRGLEGLRSPMVGRQSEWNRLIAATWQVLLGGGQIVSIVGEAGIGKSRLVAEMHQHVSDSQDLAVRWIESRCLSYTEAVSYWPFQEILRQMVGIEPDAGEEEAWQRLKEAVAQRFPLSETPTVLPYMATFLNLPLPDDLQDRVRHLDAEGLQRRTFVALSSWFEAYLLQGRPLVLVIEDVHWIDQASLALLEHLLPLAYRLPLLLLLIYRPEHGKRCAQLREKLAREYSYCSAELLLQPLTPADSQQLLENLIAIESWPSDLQELILSRTEGNPLYLEEMIRVLIDDAVLVHEESGHWRVTDKKVQSDQVPDALQGVMMARLDQLQEPCRWIAQIASVVGRSFSFDVLSQLITPKDEKQLRACLTHLEEHEILRRVGQTAPPSYTFKHVLLQEVCYRSLLVRTRRQYHRQIAAYLESHRSAGRRDVDSEAPIIAHHALAGHDWPRALRYQLQVGEQEQRLFANDEAIEHFQKALESAQHLSDEETAQQRLHAHAALGELFTTTGQYEEARDHLEAAYELATEMGDRDTQIHACRWLARMYELRGEYFSAVDWVQQGLVDLRGRETIDAAELRLIVGLINTRMGDYNNALRHCQKALQIAEKLGAVTVLARAYTLFGHLNLLRSDSPQAVEHFRKALDLYDLTGDINGQAVAQNQIANAYFDMGQWSAAERHYRRARAIFNQTSDVYNRAFADNNLAEIALNQGRLDEALDLYRKALRTMEHTGSSAYVLGALHMNLGHTFMRRGEVDTARHHLYTSREYFEQAQARDFLPELYRHLTEASLLTGDLEQAQSQAHEALELAHELSMLSEKGIIHRILGQIALARQQFAEAARHLEESLDLLQEARDEYQAARTRLELARLHLSQHKARAGLVALRHSIPIFERLGAGLELDTARSLREELEQTDRRLKME